MRFFAKLRFPSFDTDGGAGAGADGGGGGGAGSGGGAGAGDGAGAGAQVVDTGAGGGGSQVQSGRSTDAAIAAARARIAAGGKVIDEGAGAGDGAGDGGSQRTGDLGGGADGADGAGQEGDGAEGTDGQDGADGEGGEKKFEVTLPSGREGEADLPIEVPDQEVHDRINRLVNRATAADRLEAAHESVAAQAAELAEAEDAITVDPVGFILDRMPDQHKLDIARQLVFEPAIFKALTKELGQALDDPANLETIQLKAQNSRLSMKETLRNALVERKEMEANGRKVVAELNRLIPKTITGSKRQMLFDDALRDIKDVAKRLGIKQMPLEDVPLAVAKRFREHGIDLRATVAGGEGASGGQPQSQAQPGAKAGEGGRSAQDFRQGSDQRRAAAAVAPAGAGAPASRARPAMPQNKGDGKSTDAAIAELRKGGIRRALGRA